MLGGAYRLEDAGLQKILEAAPNLTHLRLVGCSRLQGPILQAMPRLLPKLRCVLLTCLCEIPTIGGYWSGWLLQAAGPHPAGHALQAAVRANRMLACKACAMTDAGLDGCCRLCGAALQSSP